MFKNIPSPVLITGATGFVGSQITRKIIDSKCEINILIRKNSNTWRINDIIDRIKYYEVDLTDKERVFTYVNKIKPKVIFHLSTYGAYPDQNEHEIIKSNILEATTNLLSACMNIKFKLFVNTGTNSEYGFSVKPMKENDLLDPNSYYGIYKAATTMLCRKVALENKLPIVTVRPFHVYGPYEEKTRLIPTLIINLLNNICPPLVSPKISRDLIFIDDVVNFYINLLNYSKLSGEIFNIGSGKNYTIETIFNKIQKICRSDVKPIWATMKNRTWDQEKWVSDMSKAKKKLNFQKKISLDTGLSKTIEWIKNNKKSYN